VVPRRRPHALLSLLLPFLLSFLLSLPAAGAFRSVGDLGLPGRDGAGLVFRGAEGTVAVSAAGDGVVRVRYTPAGTAPFPASWAVPGAPPLSAPPAVVVGEGRSTVSSGSLTAAVAHAPLRVSFASGGETIDADDPLRGMAVSGSAVRVWKRLREDERVYGLGEKAGPLEKRGSRPGGAALAMWNTDAYAWGDGTDPLYASVPFFLVLRNGRAHGVFLDNPYRTSFDVGREDPALLSFGATGGELDYYLIDGPSPKDVIRRYTALTGRMPLPPLWALGYHQCRYSYFPEARVREVARDFRKRRIPADAVWLDIHWQEGYRPFAWDRERFPDPPGLVSDLAADGFRTVVIVDPHPAKAPGTRPFDEGLAGGHFVTLPGGALYEASVWPAKAEKDAVPSVFPDFARDATRRWWGSLHDDLVKAGVAGIWNDMNEPAVFDSATKTFPLDARHDVDGRATDHREIHNVYGMLQSRATHEGLLALRPGARPFVLTRATFAGGQRWAAVWPGDNVSTWGHLRGSVPLLLGLGLSGFPFAGSDVGGYVGGATAELYTRWLQSAVLTPFLRTHTAWGNPEQDPWSYGARHERANRKAIELRYELLPTIYSVMEEASRTGVPAMRPLFLEHPGDPRTWDRDDEYLFGGDLLVAPVLREGARRRRVYLPAGAWWEPGRGLRHVGGGEVDVPVGLETLPLFVREGAFLFRGPVLRHTGERHGKTLTVQHWPARAPSSGELYEDEGDGFAYRDGVFLRRTFTSAPSPEGLVVEVRAEGTWRPAPRALELRVRWEGPLRAVRVDGAPLGRTAPGRLGAGGRGWTRDGAFAVVRLADTSEALRVELVR
jgi:alpha-glucosidase